jgi:TPP-dependent pyruvate/acetoin dehydrogenase alpha subunit
VRPPQRPTPLLTERSQGSGPDALAEDLCRSMIRIRVIEELIADRYADQQMRCPVHLSIGQEGAAVGVCAALRSADYAVSGHRSHGHYLAKGGNLRAMMAELYGRVDGCSRGKGGSMHLVDLDVGFLGATPIVGSTIAIGVGAAFASSLRSEDRLAAVFFGDGATEAGIFHESLNFAVLHRLPVLFVCENNLYSVYSPLAVRQPAHRSIHGLAASHGMPAHSVDGNDVSAVHRAAVVAVDGIRRGEGPAFLELSTYRWREHCGPNWDDQLGYRPVGELASWQRSDPVVAATEALTAAGRCDQTGIDAMFSEAREEALSAVEFARASPFPDADELHRDVYADGPGSPWA